MGIRDWKSWLKRDDPREEACEELCRALPGARVAAEDFSLVGRSRAARCAYSCPSAFRTTRRRYNCSNRRATSTWIGTTKSKRPC